MPKVTRDKAQTLHGLIILHIFRSLVDRGRVRDAVDHTLNALPYLLAILHAGMSWYARHIDRDKGIKIHLDVLTVGRTNQMIARHCNIPLLWQSRQAPRG